MSQPRGDGFLDTESELLIVAKHDTNTVPVMDRSCRPKAIGRWKSVFLGCILGLDAAGHCLALATLCFAGALAAGLSLATGAFVLASALVTLALLVFSKFRVCLGIAQDTSISILAPVVIAVGVTLDALPEARVVTAFAIIGISALSSGLVFFLVGALGLGRTIRLFPYPVAAGFLASSGFLLVAASLSVNAAEAPEGSTLRSPELLYNLVPSLALAIALFLSTRRSASAAPVLLLIVLAVALFYGVTSMIGLSDQSLSELGLVSSAKGGGTLGYGDLSVFEIEWQAVLMAWPVIAAVVVINLVGVLLNTIGTELGLQQDVDADRELRVTGAANVFIGLFGGLAGFLQSGATILASQLEAQRLPLGLGYVGVLLLTFFFVSDIVSVVPTFVATGLLLFIGLVMLDAWLVGSWKRLMLIDRFTVVGIVGLTAAFGILPAVAIGLLIALLGFALGFIRLPVICAASDGSAIRSVVDRSQRETEILNERGDAIQVLKLQGALFFGSVDRLNDVVIRLLDRVPDAAFLILDASEVNTIDSAACAAFDKLHFLTADRGVALIITQLKPGQRSVFERWGTHLDDDLSGDCAAIAAYPTLDCALEDCEDLLLDRRLGLYRQWSVEEILSRLGDGHPRVPDLVALLSPVHLVDGELLIRKGETGSDIFILESGRLVVRLVTPAGDTLRVRAMAPGSLVGESAHILGTPRNADVVAEGPVTAWRLGVREMADMETNDRDLAALTYLIIAHALALKVVQTNDIISTFTGRGLQESKFDERPPRDDLNP